MPSSRAPYTTEQMVEIYKMLHRLGGPKGIIRQTEFFVYSEKDRQALEQCMALGYKFPEITTWIRATKSDFALVTMSISSFTRGAGIHPVMTDTAPWLARSSRACSNARLSMPKVTRCSKKSRCLTLRASL